MNAKQAFRQANLTKWTTIFQEQKSSGLTVKEWCAQNNISHHAFYYWKRLAKEAYVQTVLPEIVPIPIDNALPVTSDDALSNVADSQLDSYNLYNSCNTPKSQPEPSPLSLTLGDIRIDIGSGASDDVISNIIKAVRHA